MSLITSGRPFHCVDIQVGRPACLPVQKYSKLYFMPRVIGSTVQRMERLIFKKSGFMRLVWCALLAGNNTKALLPMGAFYSYLV